MAGYDRDEVLTRTDLATLATEICGPPTGHGRGAKWHCPNPDHPDTHPSMTIFDGRRSQRWKCHACSEGGTAIDLWVITHHVSVGDAISALGERAGVTPPDSASDSASDSAPSLKHLLAAPVSPYAAAAGGRRTTALSYPDTFDGRVEGTFDGRVESYVAAATNMLWSAEGQGILDWLHDRGFADDVLRANRVGYDPGPRALRRANGLPHRGVGVVLPILNTGGHAIWVQTRYLNPGGTGRKYDSVVTDIAPNPRVATIRTPNPCCPGVVVLTEGIPDGLAVAHTGTQPVAVVGTGNTGPDVAESLHAAFPDTTFIVAFDNDASGRATGPRLGGHLAELGHAVIASGPPPEHNDLNDWWRANPDAVVCHLAVTAKPAIYHPAALATLPTMAL